MAPITKDALLGGSDLREKEVKLDALDGETVIVRGLGAAFSNDAQFFATEVRQVGRDQIIKVNPTKMEAMTLLHGLVDPKLDSTEEAEEFLRRYGPTASQVVEAINELSDIDAEAVKETRARFPSGEESGNGGTGRDGTPAGNGKPDLPARPGA